MIIESRNMHLQKLILEKHSFNDGCNRHEYYVFLSKTFRIACLNSFYDNLQIGSIMELSSTNQKKSVLAEI